MDKLDKEISTAVVSSHNDSNKTTTYYTKKIKTGTWKALRSILETAARRCFGLKQ
jgi:hypothetical protein